MSPDAFVAAASAWALSPGFNRVAKNVWPAVAAVENEEPGDESEAA